ncbi:hypothetical protein M758_9G182400 [Ceratodon purpureus]|nr:hypothetical protein M758_9G182400 [Ceratodon purpureus]
MEDEVKYEVNDKGVMVVHRPRVPDEFYEITKIPSDAMYLVQREKKGILKGLGLQSVLTELNRASDLLFLAYMGVVGTGELHARISNRQMELSKLCSECLLTMDALRDGSVLVLKRLTEAYKYLLQGKETRALKILSKIAEVAGNMSDACAKLAVGFGKLSDDTQADAASAAVALGAQVVKVHNLKTLRDKWQANKRKQEAQSKLLNEQIRKMEADIAEGKAKEELADKRAFISGLVGAFAGAVSLGITQVVTAAHPMRAFMPPVNHHTPQPGTSPAPSEGKDTTSDEDVQKLRIKEDKLRSAKKAVEDADSELQKVQETGRTMRNKVLDAKSVKEAKEKRLKAAKAGDKTEAGYKEKVKQAETELEESTQKLAKLELEQKEAEKDLKAAEKTKIDAEAAVKTIAASLNSIGDSAREVSKAQADRSKEIASNVRVLVAAKLQMEETRRESVGLLEELTSLLEANTEMTRVEESSQVALEIAGWALQNVFAALSNAKLFWDSMKTFCEKLAKPDVIDKIKFEVEDAGSIEERIEVYKGEDFVQEAMTYVAKWAALTVVCGEYIKASEVARQSVLDHIRAGPTIEEARRQIGPLKARLLDEIQKDAGESAVMIDDLRAEERKLIASGTSVDKIKPNVGESFVNIDDLKAEDPLDA